MTRSARIRLLVFAVIGAMAAIYVGARYAGLFPADSYSVRVALARSGGLFDRAEVTWRGVTVGRVTALTPKRDGVVATLRIDQRWRIPAALKANVHNRSAVGEQYLDLEPTTDSAPYLHDGSTVDVAHTSTPIEDQQFVLAMHRLLAGIDPQALGTTIDGSAAAVGGASSDLRQIIDNWSTILAAATASLPAQLTLLGAGYDVLATQNALAPTIRSWADHGLVVANVLTQHQADLVHILESGTTAATALRTLAQALQPNLPPLLANVAVISSITNQRLSGIEELLVALPWALASAETPGRDGLAHFTFVGTSTPEACQAGYIRPPQWKSALDPTPSVLPPNIHCAQPGAAPRGSNAAHPLN